MENSKQLAHRFREVVLNGKWVANTNLKEQLSSVTWEQALHKIGSLNTIAALTYHLNYYTAGVLNVLAGGNLEIRDKYSFDLPEINAEKAWEDLKNELWENAENFASQVEKLSDQDLEETFVDEKYGTYQRNIEAIIEHNYYHLGQISLIHKMLKELGTG